LIIMMGGLLGLGIGWVLVQGAAREMGASLPGVYLSPEAMLFAVGIMIGAGILAGLFPALKAMRLSIVDALARG
jgi:putative ABC transport system permease protein